MLLTRLRRWSEASVLEDLDVFIAVEVALEEVWVREPCLARSWSPGLGSPTLVVPVFIMAARHGLNLHFDRKDKKLPFHKISQKFILKKVVLLICPSIHC